MPLRKSSFLHGGIMINLYGEKELVVKFICESINQFAEENPAEVVSTIGIYLCPWAGWMITSFNDKNSSDEFVNQCKQNNSNCYGKDSIGEYCDNCPDFKFSVYTDLNCENWKEECEKHGTIKVKTELLKNVIADCELNGDEAINEVFFRFFNSLIFDDSILESLNSIQVSSDFRMGVQLLDSEFVNFELLKK